MSWSEGVKDWNGRGQVEKKNQGDKDSREDEQKCGQFMSVDSEVPFQPTSQPS